MQYRFPSGGRCPGGPWSGPVARGTQLELCPHMLHGRKSYILERKADESGWDSKSTEFLKCFRFSLQSSNIPAVLSPTFTCAALADEPHHERGALVTLSGCVECLHHKLMCFGLRRARQTHSAVKHRNLRHDRTTASNKRPTLGEERPMLP